MEGWTGVMVIWWGEGGSNLKDVGAKVPSLGSIASQGQVGLRRAGKCPSQCGGTGNYNDFGR